MTEQTQTGFKIELDLRPKAPHMRFDSVEDLGKWLEKESEFWNWLEQVRQKNQRAHSRLNNYHSKLNQLMNIYNNLKNGQGNFAHFVSQMNSHLEQYYKGGKLIHSGDPRAKFIKSIVEDNPVHAANVLFYMTERQFDMNTQHFPNDFQAALAALLFEWNVKGKNKGESKALEELRSSWADNLKESNEDLARQLDEMKKVIGDAEANKDNQNKQFDELIRKLKSLSDDMVKKTKEKFHEIETLYQKKLALHSAITYWGSKGKWHAIKAGGLFVLVLIAFGGVGAGLYFSIAEVVGGDTLQTVPLWKLSLLVLIAVIGIWMLRVLVRLLLSNIHLADDARERKTMILTYLALLKEGELSDEKSRLLILQALFRPSSTGIVKDDAAPPFMAEWLKRTTGTD